MIDRVVSPLSKIIKYAASGHLRDGLEGEVGLDEVVDLEDEADLSRACLTTEVELFHFLTDYSLSLRTYDFVSFLD